MSKKSPAHKGPEYTPEQLAKHREFEALTIRVRKLVKPDESNH
jgi:hypothetical protein